MGSWATLYCLTDNLLVALESNSFRSMCSSHQLQQLRSSVNYFREMIPVTQANQNDLTPVDKELIKKASRVIYEVDDLVDELLTGSHLERWGSTFESLETNRFNWHFPHKMQWKDQFKMKLEELVDCVGPSTYRFPRNMLWMDETFLDVEDIVGREEELQAVLQMLLHSSFDAVAIMGIRGIGKTTLAKLLFNHPTVQTEFPLRFWARISELSGPFNIKDILSDILTSAQRCSLSVPPGSLPLPPSDLSIGRIQLQEMIGENKYLLVLDDMCNVDPIDWLRFKAVLPKGGEGSRILVTTSSNETARIVGDLKPYELKGLSQPDSWGLFKRTAFLNRKDNSAPQREFVQLAMQIVHKCCSHPGAIKEVATLCQDFRVWKSFQEHGPEIFNQPSWTWQSLKLSYYGLGLTLQSCFNYCALFPLDFVIHKRMLIRLWMAQGYIVSSKEDQSIEDVGDYYFSILLEKGFFEVVEMDECGEIVSCKMRGLMHIVAKEVAGEEFCEANSTLDVIGDSASHLFQSGDPPAGNSLFTKTNIRSYLRDACSQLSVDALVKQWRSLRTLDLHGLDMKTLPDSIGGLLHLRYLDLSHNKYLEALPNSIVKLRKLQTLDLRFCALLKELPDSIGELSHLRYLDLSNNIYLKALPNSIVKLRNLQTLNLRSCALLKELPQEFSRLSALRCLDTFGCDGLTQMPPGMEKLIRLQHLSLFVVAEGISSAEIRDLKKLVNLRGRICISIPRSYTHVKRIDWRGGCLKAHEHLQEVWVRFLESSSGDNSDQRVVNYHQIVLEKLQPHGNIKKLMLWGYQGAIITKWGRAEDDWADTLSSLVKIELRSCEKLKQLPRLSSLLHLKSLKLHGLRELEYLEIAAISSTTQVARTFFPSLQELQITNAPKLRGLWDGNIIPNFSTFAPSLVRLEIRSCEKLQQLPLRSNLSLLKSLKLYGLSNLEYLGKMFISTTSSSIQPHTTFLPFLEELEIVDAPKLRGSGIVVKLTDYNNKASFEASCFRSLKSLVLANLPELKEFYSLEAGDDRNYTLQFGCLSELRVSNCPKLISMPLVPTLEVLEVINVHVDILKHIVGTQGFRASSSTSSTLRKVHIVAVPELRYLLLSLSNVESLTIRQCELLDTLALGSPAYVKRLTIQECGKLKHILPELNQLSCLEELEIKDCEDLDWNIKDAGGSAIAWQNLKTVRLINRNSG